MLDLLQSALYLRLKQAPGLLESLIDAAPADQVIVIDEIQRIPMLLNEAHRLIEERHRRFLLTGSSARKLRREGTNLLAGRAIPAKMFPLTYAELATDFELEKYLRFGGLPLVWTSQIAEEILWAYCETYLKEEIQVEAVVRNLGAFTRFLKVAAAANGQILNYSKIASDSGVPTSTVRQSFQVLDDTLLGFSLPAWQGSQRKAVQTSKFFFFDIGVANTLAQIKVLDRQSDLYGRAMEHFILCELRAYLSYRRIHKSLYFWRTKHGEEVDIVLDDELAIEVKASERVSNRDLRGLAKLAEEKKHQRFILVSQDPLTRRQGIYEMFYWKDFLDKLWADEIVG
ncbi:MAG: DUF4143 domain-containing protein [Myxococcota bacterium]